MKHLGAVLLATAVLSLALTSCGGGDQDAPASKDPRPDPAHWRSMVEDRIGHPFRNDAAWAEYRDSWTDLCADKDAADDWSMYVAVATDGGSMASDIEEDVSYACPEDLEDVRGAIEQVQGAVSDVNEACALSPQLRTEEQQLLVEAVGC